MLGERRSPINLAEEEFNEENLKINMDSSANLSPTTHPPLSFSFSSLLTLGTALGSADLQRQMPESQLMYPLGPPSLKNDSNLYEVEKNYQSVSASAVSSTAGLSYMSDRSEPGISFDCSKQASSQQKPPVTSRGTMDGSLFCDRHGELVLNLEALQTNGEWMESIETKENVLQEQGPFHSDSWAKWSDQDANFLRGPHRSFSLGSHNDRAPGFNQDPLISLEDETLSFSNEVSSSLRGSSTTDLDDDPLSWAARSDKNSDDPDKIDSTSWLKPLPDHSAEAHSHSAVGRFNSLILTSAKRFRAEYYLPLSGENLENESATGCAENLNALKARYIAMRDGNRKASSPTTSPQVQVSKSRQHVTESAVRSKNNRVRNKEGSPLPKSRRSFETLQSSTLEKKPNRGNSQKQVGSTKDSKVLQGSNVSRVHAFVTSNGPNQDASSQMLDEFGNCLTQEDNLNPIVALEHHENGKTENFIGNIEEEGKLENTRTSICLMSDLGSASKSLPSAKDLKDSEEFSTRNHIENLVGMLEFDGKEGMDCQLYGISTSNIEAESSKIICRFPQARSSSMTGSEKPAIRAITDGRFPSENSNGTVRDLDLVLEKNFGKCSVKTGSSVEGASGKRKDPHKISKDKFESSYKPPPDCKNLSCALFVPANAKHALSEKNSTREVEYLSPDAQKSSQVVDVDAFCLHSGTADPDHTSSEPSSASFQVALQQFEREIEKMTENKLKQEAAESSFCEPEGNLSHVSNQDSTDQMSTENSVPDASNPANIFLAAYSMTIEEQKEQMKRCDNGKQYDIKSTEGDSRKWGGSVSNHLTIVNNDRPGSPVSSMELESPCDKLMSKTSGENVSGSVDSLDEVPPRHRLSTKIVRSLPFGEGKKVINTACSEASKVYPKKNHFSRSPSPAREWTSQEGHHLGVARDGSTHENRASSWPKEGKFKMLKTRCNKQWPAVKKHYHLVKDGGEGKTRLESVSVDLLLTNKIVKDVESSFRLDGTLLSSDIDPVTARTKRITETASVSRAELVRNDASEVQKNHHNTFIPGFPEDSIESEISSLTGRTSCQPSNCIPKQSTGAYSGDYLEDKLQKRELAGLDVSSGHLTTLKTGQFDSATVFEGTNSTQPELFHLQGVGIKSDNTPNFGDLPNNQGYFTEAETNLKQSKEQELSWINIQPPKMNKERQEDVWHILDKRELQKTSKINGVENIAAASLSIYKNPLWSEELMSEFDTHKSSQDKEMDTAITREGYKVLPYFGNFESVFCPESLEESCNVEKLGETFTPPFSETLEANVFSLDSCLISDFNHPETGSKISQLQGSDSDNLINESSSTLKNCISRLEKLRRKTDGFISEANCTQTHSSYEGEARRSFNKPEEEINRSLGQTLERRTEKACQDEYRKSFKYTCQLNPVTIGGIQDHSPNFKVEDWVHKTYPNKQLKQLDTLGNTMTSNQSIVINSERLFQTISQKPDAWTQNGAQKVINHSSFNPLEVPTSETLGYVGEEQAMRSQKSNSDGPKRKGVKQSDRKNRTNNDHKTLTVDGDMNVCEMSAITCLSSTFEKKHSEMSWKKATDMATNDHISFSQNQLTPFQDAANSDVFLSRTELVPLQVDLGTVKVKAEGADLLQPQAPLNQGTAGICLSESSKVDEAFEGQNISNKGSVQELFADSCNISERFSMEFEPVPGCLHLETTRSCKVVTNAETLQPVAQSCSSPSNVTDRKHGKSRSEKDSSGHEKLSIYVDQQETSFSATASSRGSLNVPDTSLEVEDVKQVTYTPCNSMAVGQEEQAVVISYPDIDRDPMSTWFRSIFLHTRKDRDTTERKDFHAKNLHLPNAWEDDLSELSRTEKNTEVLEEEISKFKQQNSKLQNIVKENEEIAAWLAKEKEAWKRQKIDNLLTSDSIEEQLTPMTRDQRLGNQPRVLSQYSRKRGASELQEFKAKLSQITADYFKKDPGWRLSIDHLEQVIAVLIEQIQSLQKVKKNKGMSLPGPNFENVCRNTCLKNDKGVLTSNRKKGKLSKESVSDSSVLVSRGKELTRSNEANGIQNSNKTEKVSTNLYKGNKKVSTGSKVQDSRLDRSVKPTFKRFSS